MYHQRYGYHSDFDGLGITGIYSHDSRHLPRGEVSSVDETARQLYREFMGVERGDEAYERDGGGRNAIGMHVGLGHANMRNGHFWENYTFYEPQSTQILTDFVKYHEEVHALHAMRNIYDENTNKEYKWGLSTLEERIRNDGYNVDLARFKNYDRSSTDDKELIANYGALYQMAKEGYDIDAFARQYLASGAPPMLAEAYQLFNETRPEVLSAPAQPASMPQELPSLEDILAATPTMGSAASEPPYEAPARRPQPQYGIFGLLAYIAHMLFGDEEQEYSGQQYQPSYA